MSLSTRHPPRWARLLPALLSVTVALWLAGYLLYWAPGGVPTGRTGVFRAGYAAVVVALSLVGLGGTLSARDRVVGLAVGSLLLVGWVPVAVAPQVWVVGLLLAVAGLLARVSPDDGVWLGAAGGLTVLTAGLLWLTVLTGPPGVGVLALVVVAGTALAVVAGLDHDGHGRTVRGVAAALVVALVLVAAVVTATSVAPPEPQLAAFDATDATCVDTPSSSERLSGRSAFGRSTTTVSRNVTVPDTGYELREPTVEQVGPDRYRIAIDPQRVGEGGDCTAQIRYELTVLEPRVTGGTVTVLVVEDGTPVVEIRTGPRSSSAGSYPLPPATPGGRRA